MVCKEVKRASNEISNSETYGRMLTARGRHNYTANFLTIGLCEVYLSLTQCLTLIYLGWGQKSEFFCLLVTTRRLQPLRCGTASGLPQHYSSPNVVPISQGPLKYIWAIDCTLLLCAWRVHPKATEGYLP